MIREVASGQPVLPVVRGPHQTLVGVLEVEGRFVLGPRQGDEAIFALLEQRAGRGAPALEPDPHVGGELKPKIDTCAARDRLVIAAARVLPPRRRTAVVEHRLTIEGDLHLAVDAPHGAQQDVVGVVIGGRPTVTVRELVLVVPRPDEQDIAHDDPARRCAPAGLEDHGAGQVAPGRRDTHIRGADTKTAGVTIEDGPEHAGRIQTGQAQPLDVSAGRDEGRDLAVGQKAVVGDRGEGRLPELLAGQMGQTHCTIVPRTGGRPRPDARDK